MCALESLAQFGYYHKSRSLYIVLTLPAPLSTENCESCVYYFNLVRAHLVLNVLSAVGLWLRCIDYLVGFTRRARAAN